MGSGQQRVADAGARQERWSDERGSVELSRPRAGVVITKVSGFATPELGRRIIRWVDGSVRDGERPAVFHDWDGATGYEPEVRREFASWYARVRKNVKEVHVLTRSKVVSMGISLVTLAVGEPVHAHSDRAAFEKALAAALGSPG